MFFTLIGKTKTHSWNYDDLKQLELNDEYPSIFRITEFQFDNHECSRNGEYEINMCTMRFEVQPLKEIIANAQNYIEDFL